MQKKRQKTVKQKEDFCNFSFSYNPPKNYRAANQGSGTISIKFLYLIILQ